MASRVLAEHLVGEVWDAGATGVEERGAWAAGSSDTEGVDAIAADAADRVELPEAEHILIVYATDDSAPRVVSASRALGPGIVIGRPELIEEVAWSEEWKKGLGPITVSDRLRVRPSFAEAPALLEGQREILIEPGQAFGTGGHASTRLVLDWVDVLAERAGGALAPTTRVLDVGTGTGVLAMAALALGARSAVGHDLDPIAAREASEWGRRNRMAERLGLFIGGIEAVAGARFELVLANLLKRELLPIAGPVARAVAPAGRLVLSGLLAADLPPVEAAFAGTGLRVLEVHEQQVGGDCWVAPLLG